ncbi:uncharacterized protein LOC124357745 [Homalodisca vitripennis]|uniref:SERTA domain-containing protein n=1 Tax=Homalodisca liturata TaxID=320908 RepID=A0A1B6J7E3_9HEMI|nr:uncharacterized protein LOC124357745 [Homalodisca vitripennis]XP_046665730.1 uncharacterized protein LOC124357745 [Homalodisca vitripennis]KAG8322238.1 hypothetical protein J6590_026490 [Homalodisca vitripennis]
MKSNGLNHNSSTKEDDDDMFGAPRSYTASFCGSRPNRPTMISAKYRQKEERRKVLKISINKLKKIEDPESSLRRSVLINNTMRKLQRESREEKLNKQQSYRCYTADLFKEDENAIDLLSTATTTTSSPLRTSDQLVDITNLPESNHKAAVTKSVEDSLGCDESMPELMDTLLSPEEVTPSSRCAAGRKRSLDEVDDCDVQDVLSQFYLPPTPRMVTSLDEDEEEELNVVDLDMPEKRPRLEGQSAADRLRETPATCVSERRLSDSSYSCGHSSIFNELQSVVYHSLIASLET